MDLSVEQVKAIADAVVVKMSPPETESIEEPTDDGSYYDESTGKVVYTDPMAKAADEAEMELIKCLPRGVVTYKGRSGSQTVNHTEESMNFINYFRKNRKTLKTMFNNR